jgi:hypothetical protein
MEEDINFAELLSYSLNTFRRGHEGYILWLLRI